MFNSKQLRLIHGRVYHIVDNVVVESNLVVGRLAMSSQYTWHPIGDGGKFEQVRLFSVHLGFGSIDEAKSLG